MERQPCSQQQNCRLQDSRMGCREDVHHRIFPRRFYDKGIAKVFRELDENKVLICRALHEEIHATGQPPEMPTAEVMQEAINRVRQERIEGAA